eukprot:gene22271-25237_t
MDKVEKVALIFLDSSSPVSACATRRYLTGIDVWIDYKTTLSSRFTMHRSIGGLADAFQSIADAKASLNPNRKKPDPKESDLEHVIENINQDIQANERMSDANRHYLDMENCTARIAARLRDMDNVDLNQHPEPDIGDTVVSNHMKFIDDQCYRAQALLNGEFYMRNLHSEE